MVDEPIEIVPGVDAGVELHADTALFPAAAATGTPSFMIAMMALSTEVTCSPKPTLKLRTAFSPAS